MEELWKDIKDYEGLYQVSDLGRVKSLLKGEKILKPGLAKGYLRVVLYKDKKRKRFMVHRLVAEAFLPNPEHKPEVDHINTNRTDNRAENLRYCTRVENQNNPLSKQKMSEALKGKHPTEETKRKISDTLKGKYTGEKNPLYGKFGKEHPKSKPIVGVNKVSGEEVWFACSYEVQRVLGITCSHIAACCSGKRKSAGGFYWYYA